MLCVGYAPNGMSRARLTLGVLLVAVLAVTAGCASAITGDPNPERIADKMQQRLDDIDTVQGVKVMKTTRNGETNTTVTEYVRQPPNKVRSKVIEGGQYRDEGDYRVNTGEKTYRYDASENTYTKYDFDYNRSEGYFDADTIERILNNSEVSYKGTDTVAGRDVHVIELTDTERDSTVTIKADQEHWYPLAYETSYSYDGITTTMSWTHRNVSFNEPVDDDTFTFEPPAGAELKETTTPDVTEFDSVSAANEATAYEVVEPDMPDSYTIESINEMVIDGSSTTTLSYRNGDKGAYYSVSNESVGSESAAGSDGESVTIGNTTGTVSSYGETTSVRWSCDGMRYSLSGQLNQSTLVEAASAVGCS